MVASRQVEIPFYRGIGRGFGAPAQVFRRIAIPFLRKYIVPAAKRVGADLLEFAVPEVAEVVSGRKNFRTAAKSVRRQTLRKKLGRKGLQAESFQHNLQNKTIRSRREVFTNISY